MTNDVVYLRYLCSDYYKHISTCSFSLFGEKQATIGCSSTHRTHRTHRTSRICIARGCAVKLLSKGVDHVLPYVINIRRTDERLNEWTISFYINPKSINRWQNNLYDTLSYHALVIFVLFIPVNPFVYLYFQNMFQLRSLISFFSIGQLRDFFFPFTNSKILFFFIGWWNK